MTAFGRFVFPLCLSCLISFAGPSLHAQGALTIEVDARGELPAAPLVIVRATGFPAGEVFRSLRLELSLNAQFQLIVYDSTKVGDAVGFSMLRLLPENREIHARATVFDAAGRPLLTTQRSLGRTGPRLELIAPNGRTAVNVSSRSPQFVWRSAGITTPPGPWIYELSITNVARGETEARGGIQDTAFTFPDTLQANTSYRWKVVARLARGAGADSAVQSSASSFVVFPSDAASATLLYQNFPNPFPGPSSSTTCIWFDLQQRSRVGLTILDLRGNLVRTMVPGMLSADLESGRYGRAIALDGSGCDVRLAWDGRADNGRTVAAGIYLVRLKTDHGTDVVKKIVFLGP